MSGREGEVLALIVVVLVFAIAPMIVGARLAERRGRSVWFGIALTFLLGWIGVVVVLLSGRRTGAARAVAARTRPCPACGAAVAATAAGCDTCGTASPAWTLHGGHWWSRDEAGAWRYLDDARGAWVSPADGSVRAATRAAAAPPPAAGASPFVGIGHVEVAAPPNREFDTRRFYGGLLGLEEIERQPPLTTRGGCWFRAGAQELHVGAAGDRAPTTTGVALRLRSGQELEELAERLEAAGYEVDWADETGARGIRRFHVQDPFGNTIELAAG